MVSLATVVKEEIRCNGIYLLYGFPAILSILFCIVLMMSDFIIPCVINKKVIN